jgi:hypothetical protein
VPIYKTTRRHTPAGNNTDVILRTLYEIGKVVVAVRVIVAVTILNNILEVSVRNSAKTPAILTEAFRGFLQFILD